MDLSAKIASEITIYGKYAKYIPELKRRETWDEIVDRYEKMMLEKYCSYYLQCQLSEWKTSDHVVGLGMSQEALYKIIREACDAVRRKEILPSMRGMQFAGSAIERNNSRIYNCAFMQASYRSFFKEVMFLLLGGTGVGYSVQERHISQLPAITGPKRDESGKIISRKYLVGDSIEGWSDAVNALFKAFFGERTLPKFDFSDVRQKGARLVTAGGKAPGPGPLRICLDKILGLLETKPQGSKLTSVEVSDLCCFIADAVLAGGIRRAAMICLFDIDDEHMLAYKKGQWWDNRPERARVNVSAVAFREFVRLSEETSDGRYAVGVFATTEDQFKKFWKATEESKSGEPGIYWTNHPDWGTNPCCEIALRHKQFCNLTTINFSTVRNQDDLNQRSRLAAVLGTLQAGFVDMHYLGTDWEDNCRKDSLLGISLTGICDKGNYQDFNFQEAAEIAKVTNEEIAKEIGINPAARITCIKPEGSASLVLGTSSGVHGRHSPFYIRRFRHNSNEAIINYLAKVTPKLVVPNVSEPDGLILELPQKSPGGSIMREEAAVDTLERLKYFRKNWIEPGHISGENSHNVSCTVSIRDDEWETCGEWLWKNRDSYNGIAVLPFSDHTYTQAPFEDCSEEVYLEMLKHVNEITLSQVSEEDDNTNMTDQIACGGGACAI